MTSPPIHHRPPSWTAALLCWGTGTLALIWLVLTVLESSTLAAGFVSRGLWERWLTVLGAELKPQTNGEVLASVPPGLPAGVLILGSLLIWLVGPAVVRGPESKYGERVRWFARAWSWLWLAAWWQVLWTVGLLAGWSPLLQFAEATVSFWVVVMLAGWLSRLATLGGVAPVPAEPPRLAWPVAAGVLLFVGVFTVLNWQLYWSLLLPHGDSAMYEEHLWNLTHGKGFRSYLDQGLFLGEHMQVIHVLLVPVYLLWPSHLLLELVEAVALGSCAIPAYWIAVRHGAGRRAAMLLAFACLAYAPLHFLEIAIDLKTFRPISLGVPLLLFGLDRLERKQFGRAAVLLLLTLSAKEDYAAVFIPLGVWTAWHFGQVDRDRKGVWFGVALSGLSLIYLVLTIKFLIPWFREGADPHYTRYFGELGNTPGDIVRSLFEQPRAVAARIDSLRTRLYAAALLVPLAGLPLLSPGRLAVGVPLFGVLSLMQLSEKTGTTATDMLIPFHHFHAPLVPLLFWSAAAALGRLSRNPASGLRWGAAAGTASLMSAAFMSYYPLGFEFWDADSAHYWRTLYVPGERAEEFAKVLEKIPPDARVASTDYVHPRFTHFARSYDYSEYERHVSGNTTRVPDDTDFIVIDTRHHYSWIHGPEDVPELRDEPDRWELLPDDTQGYFLVLKRKPPADDGN